MSQLTIVGAGYVGLVTGVCFADLGNQVTILDVDERKIRMLQTGESPIYEPRLEELIRRNLDFGRVSFTTSYPEALRDAEFILICVGTPQGNDGEADLRYVRSAASSIAETIHLARPGAVVINKSTVPVGTGDLIEKIIQEKQIQVTPFSVVSCPEFLQEGSAVENFLNPDRVVIGSTDNAAAQRVAQLFLPLRTKIIITDLRSAEMIKYAANAYLATRVSYINLIAELCEETGANVLDVIDGIGSDRRIGPHYLRPGVGFGGSCLPKDTQALDFAAEQYGVDSQLLGAVLEINQRQPESLVAKLLRIYPNLQGKIIGILGLSFKPDTDDIREAPALTIIHQLQKLGAKVKAYDPVAIPNAQAVLKDVSFTKDSYDLAAGCWAILVVTEWNEFRQISFERIRDLMQRPVLIDGRNLYIKEDRRKLRDLGFTYVGIG